MSDLARHLATLAPDSLAGLLAARPDTLAEPRPDTLGELAARLESGMSVRRLLWDLNAHVLIVAQIAVALGDGCTRERVLEILPEAQEDAAAALEVLQSYALVWPAGKQEVTRGKQQVTRLEPDRHQLRVASGLVACFPHPLGLGPALATLLEARSVPMLQILLDRYGLRIDGRKEDLIQRLVLRLTSRDTINHIVETGPPGTSELLTRAMLEGGVELDFDDYGTSVWLDRLRPRPMGADRTPAAWLMEWGVLHQIEYDWAVLPRDVALATSPDGSGDPAALYLAPAPPPPPSVPIDPAAVERASAGSATAFLDLARVLLESIAAAPPPALKTGGIGVREIRRFGKDVGRSEGEVTLALTLLATAGLLTAGVEAVLVTPAYDAWLAAPPPHRYAALVAAWWGLPFTPDHTDQSEGKVAVLGRRQPPPDAGMRSFRHDLVAGLVGLGESSAVASTEALDMWCRFEHPMHLPMDPELHAPAIWNEAEQLGLVALQAASPAARALVKGSVEDLLAAAERLVPSTGNTATFQADLTAMVSGSPSAGISALLGSAADVESRGHATVWRFSPGSVRRALDAGTSAEDLLAELEAVASVRPLPQPLTYLIRDVERRHGSLRVAPVACCVTSADEALLAEVAHTRALSALRLRILAPTVLASGASVEQTLRSLRNAGYAPVQEDATGQVVLERAPSRRAEGVAVEGLAVELPARRLVDDVETVTDAFTTAAALLGTSQKLSLPAKVKGVLFNDAVIARLGHDSVRVLAWALEKRGVVQLEYVDERGNAVRERARRVDGQSPHAVAVTSADGERRRGVHLNSIIAVGPAVEGEEL